MTQHTKRWEDRFNKEFTFVGHMGEQRLTIFRVTSFLKDDPILLGDEVLINDLKSFIKSVELQTLERVVEMVDGMKIVQEVLGEGTRYKSPKNCSCIPQEGQCDECVIFDKNEILSSLKDLLTNEIEKLK